MFNYFHINYSNNLFFNPFNNFITKFPLMFLQNPFFSIINFYVFTILLKRISQYNFSNYFINFCLTNSIVNFHCSFNSLFDNIYKFTFFDYNFNYFTYYNFMFFRSTLHCKNIFRFSIDDITITILDSAFFVFYILSISSYYYYTYIISFTIVMFNTLHVTFIY